MKPKKIFVLWSGGLDSTYLVARCLADPRYELVEAGYVRVRNNPEKAAAEAAAIARLYPHFQADPRFFFRGVVLDLELPRTNPNLAYKQVPLWLLAVVAGLHMPVDEVAIGYHGASPGEEPMPLREVRALYDAHRPFLHRRPPRLVFPLSRLTKARIYEALDPVLREACIPCEAPALGPTGYAACGRCRTCARRQRELGA